MVTPELAAGTSDGVLSMATALGVGLLVGLERERRKAAGHGSAAGVRTFALVALLGVLAARAGAAAVATAVVFVGAIALLGYARTPGSGMTTEVALVVTFLLGALAHVDVELAARIAGPRRWRPWSRAAGRRPLRDALAPPPTSRRMSAGERSTSRLRSSSRRPSRSCWPRLISCRTRWGARAPSSPRPGPASPRGVRALNVCGFPGARGGELGMPARPSGG